MGPGHHERWRAAADSWMWKNKTKGKAKKKLLQILKKKENFERDNRRRRHVWRDSNLVCFLPLPTRSGFPRKNWPFHPSKGRLGNQHLKICLSYRPVPFCLSIFVTRDILWTLIYMSRPIICFIILNFFCITDLIENLSNKIYITYSWRFMLEDTEYKRLKLIWTSKNDKRTLCHPRRIVQSLKMWSESFVELGVLNIALQKIKSMNITSLSDLLTKLQVSDWLDFSQSC